MGLIVLFNTAMSAAFWFRDIIREATFGGHHTVPVQRGLRMGFALFILSEVMFFSLFSGLFSMFQLILRLN